MKVLLDEQHETVPATRAGFGAFKNGALKNGALLRAAEDADFDVLGTGDRSRETWCSRVDRLRAFRAFEEIFGIEPR